MAKLELPCLGTPQFTVYVNDGNGSETLRGAYEIAGLDELTAIAKHAMGTNTEVRVTFKVMRLQYAGTRTR